MATPDGIMCESFFNLDKEIIVYLNGCDDSDLLSMEKLHENLESFEEMRLHIFTCLLLYLRTGATVHAEKAFNRARHLNTVAGPGVKDEASKILETAVIMKDDGRSLVQSFTLNEIRRQLKTRLEESGLLTAPPPGVYGTFQRLQSTPQDDSTWVPLLLGLAGVFKKRFEQSTPRDIRDLSLAINFALIGLRATPEDDSLYRSKRLQSLSKLHFARFEHTGSMDDLDRTIQLREQALVLTSSTDANWAVQSHNLGDCYGERFEMNGHIEDLNRCIIFLEQAATSTAQRQNMQLQGQSLSSLAYRLRRRFDWTGSTDDLNRAVAACERSTNLSVEGHDLTERMTCLGTCLARRFERAGSMEDLDRALQLLRSAVSLMPTDYPHRGETLNNLGTTLGLKYGMTKSVADLDDAIEATGKALEALPSDHPVRVLALSNLSRWFRKLFGEKGLRSDLDRAIEVSGEAIDRVPVDHVERPSMLNNRAELFLKRMKLDNSTCDQALALDHLQQGLDCPNIHPAVQATLALRCSEIFISRLDWQRAASMLCTAVELLPLLSPRSLQHLDKQHELKHFQGLSSRAASAALNANLGPVHALQLLESGRNIISTMVMEVRTDISLLEQQHPNLAKEFCSLRDVFDTPDSTAGVSGTWNNRNQGKLGSGSRMKADRDLRDVLRKIRLCHGFKRFALPPTEDEIKVAANPDPIIVINATAYRSDAILITKNQIRLLELPNLKPIEILLIFLQTRQSGMHSSSSTSKLLGLLWDTLCEPVLDALGYRSPVTDDNWPRVWWIPVGALSILPLHAAGHHGSRSRRSVLDRVMSSYATSVKALIHGRESHNRQSAGPPSNKALVIGMSDTPGFGQSQSLPFAATEVAMVERVCSSLKLHLSRPELRRASVLDQLRSCRIFHFAGHGKTHESEPSKCGLLLEDWQSGLLTVADVRDLSFERDPPFLCYLSACSTGANLASSNLLDEAINLVSAFQLAGFRHTVGTLWEVRDKSSNDVARVLYETVRKEGLTDSAICRGLHFAVRELRAGTVKGVSEGRDATLVSSLMGQLKAIDYDWIPYVHFGILSGI
ncbi:hypothetical protein BFJ72_g14653 [Fusarium proliferatum]|uniref:CHAT domain-containing protein n=1 Tax=Gibberella intermedia TaxID=948311 RepID=A0A420S0F6_GIBIN|nr:hypothetical protein BFJ72_g14653 [Fusarium proliferatum]